MRNANAALALLAVIAIRLREFFHESFSAACLPQNGGYCIAIVFHFEQSFRKGGL